MYVLVAIRGYFDGAICYLLFARHQCIDELDNLDN